VSSWVVTMGQSFTSAREDGTYLDESKISEYRTVPRERDEGDVLCSEPAAALRYPSRMSA